MIAVDAVGRMGNTLFQFAFAHAAARRLDTRFVLGPAPLWEGFELGPWGRPGVRLARKLALRIRHGADGPERTVVDNAADPVAVLAELRDGVAYNGFFQSEAYFADHASEVRRLLTVRRHHREEFAARYGTVGPYACVHVRRGDYLQNGWALPVGYFRRAIDALGDLEGRPVLVISDDEALARAELGDLPRVRFESNAAMVDLQLLMHADRLVLSNSSFSWWGAWLNELEGLRVVAPRHWVGFREGVEVPRGVLPSRWEQVAVTV